MDAGWAWQIEHDHLINRGYVFSSAFLSDDEAAAEFIRKNPKVKDPRLITFTSGVYERSWVKNVVAIGNASGFVEPLEATSLAVICESSALLIETLVDSQFLIHPTARKYYNQTARHTWDSIRRFLAMHYKFNTRLDTPFWKACREDTDLTGAEEIVEYYQTSGPSVMWSHHAMGPTDQFNWEGYLVMLVGQKSPIRWISRPRSRKPKPLSNSAGRFWTAPKTPSPCAKRSTSFARTIGSGIPIFTGKPVAGAANGRCSLAVCPSGVDGQRDR